MACLALVLVFRESTRLAAAYGVAVTGPMAITSVIYFQVTRGTWGWPLWKALPPLLLFLSFDLPFFVSTLSKFPEGGFVPVLIGLGFFVVMFTWRRGWDLYRKHLRETVPPLDEFIAEAARERSRASAAPACASGATSMGVPPVLSNLVTRVGCCPSELS